MKSQIFGDSADVGNFLQIGIHLLIAQNREDMAGIATSGVALIFFDYCQRRR